MDTPVIFIFVLVLEVVYCNLIKLSCEDIRKIVDGHNSRRLQIANGEVAGQPAAPKMNSLVWDKELAEKAETWAKNDLVAHNPDRLVESGRFELGDNIYTFRTPAANTNYDFDLDMVLDSWFNESKDYKFTPIPTEKREGDKMIGHYTQMVWSDSVYIGCAQTKFLKEEDIEIIVVCNYGPGGNFQGQVPYTSGPPSGRLDCGAESCSQPYGPSC